jgi:hypothetical protein
VASGAEAFKRDDPNVEVRFFDRARDAHSRNRSRDPHFPRNPPVETSRH